MADVNTAFAKAGTLEASVRRFALQLLLNACGRSSETACCTWDSIDYDHGMDAAYISIAQSKSAKVKLIALVAGADRSRCVLLALGDYLAMSPTAVYKADEPAWLIPQLQVKRPGSTLGDWLRALRTQARGGDDKYWDFAVESLPKRVSAGGVRPGAANTYMSFAHTYM